jgi:hypothetical protein
VRAREQPRERRRRSRALEQRRGVGPRRREAARLDLEADPREPQRVALGPRGDQVGADSQDLLDVERRAAARLVERLQQRVEPQLVVGLGGRAAPAQQVERT